MIIQIERKLALWEARKRRVDDCIDTMKQGDECWGSLQTASKTYGDFIGDLKELLQTAKAR